MSKYGFLSDGYQKTTSANIDSVDTTLNSRIKELEDILTQDSLDNIDVDKSTEDAMNSISKSINDSYFKYYSPSRYNTYLSESSTNTSNYGVGFLLGEYEGLAYVVDVFEGSSAQTQGVKRGDFIVGINGDVRTDWSVSEASNALSSQDETSIWVTFRRPKTLSTSGGDEFTLELKTSKTTAQCITSNLDENVGYIKVAQITTDSGDEVSRQVAALEASGAKSYILDLRDCPGGYLTQAKKICSVFMSSGTFCQVKTKDGIASRTIDGMVATSKPLVVLVNGNTASSAEVIASALQYNNIARVIGVKTMGKGSIQSLKKLSFGGAIKYTVAYYLTPDGKDIENTGVSPNIYVENSSNRDNQYKIAKNLVD